MLPRCLLRRIACSVTATLLLVGTAGCGSDAGPAAANTDDGWAPVEVRNMFGTTHIDVKPERVVTIGYNEQDFALALGVVPVGVRTFLGYDAVNRPWAASLLPKHHLPTVGAEELDLEKVAALEPDLILGINSYIDKEQYDLLTAIAPTVAQPAGYAKGATPWDEQTRLIGKALGRESRAADVIARTRDAFDKAAKAHPEFAGKSASFALGGAYSLGADDYRTGWLVDLGFTVPKHSGKVSEERLDLFDTDVLVLEGAGADLTGSAVFASLDAVEEGRVVDLGEFDDDFAGALGFNSPLSLPYVLDVAVPRLADAVDGDPATEVAPYPGRS